MELIRFQQLIMTWQSANIQVWQQYKPPHDCCQWETLAWYILHQKTPSHSFSSYIRPALCLNSLMSNPEEENATIINSFSFFKANLGLPNRIITLKSKVSRTEFYKRHNHKFEPKQQLRKSHKVHLASPCYTRFAEGSARCAWLRGSIQPELQKRSPALAAGRREPASGWDCFGHRKKYGEQGGVHTLPCKAAITITGHNHHLWALPALL